MKIKPNYLIIPLITIITTTSASVFTQQGLTDYYKLTPGPINPPGFIISLAWTIIYILTPVSALIIANKKTKLKSQILLLFTLNALLNVFWVFLFFTQKMIYLSIYEILLLELTNILLVIQTRKVSKTASNLLYPYLIWVAFATFLNITIYLVNK